MIAQKARIYRASVFVRRSSRFVARTSVSEIQTELKTKKRNVSEICEEWIGHLRASEDKIQSFLYVDEASIYQQAADLDARIRNEGNGLPGPLTGVPIAIKDNICTRGIPTTAGSKVLENYIPSYDATVVEKLKAAGAIIIGKTNMDEFGMGNSTENSAYKITKNPWDIERVPGGSSGGSASSIAANQCLVSLGSDTGGSIRQPAHFCGCVGIKPSYGRVSRYGLIAYGSSLDTIGPIAKNVKDAAIVLQTISGVDPNDATSVDSSIPDWTSGLLPAEALSDRPFAKKRVGVIKETLGEGVDPRIVESIQNTIRHFEHLGAEIHEVSVKDFEIGLPSYYIIAFSEASSNLSRYDGVRYGLRKQADDIQSLYMNTRMEGLGAEVRRRILMGTYALSAGYYDAYYKRAQKVRSLVTQELNHALTNLDVLVTPGASTLPWKIGSSFTDPLFVYKADLMAIGCNLAGLPGIVLPIDTVQVDGKQLPVGIQLLGKSFGEKSLIEISHVLEQTLSRP